MLDSVTRRGSGSNRSFNSSGRSRKKVQVTPQHHRLEGPTPREACLNMTTAELLGARFETKKIEALWNKTEQLQHRLSVPPTVDIKADIKASPPQDKSAVRIPPLAMGKIAERSASVKSSSALNPSLTARSFRHAMEYLKTNRPLPPAPSLAQLIYYCSLSVVRIALYACFIINVVIGLDALEKQRRLMLLEGHTL
eukprot:Blabericola_migrator_1__12917@NODE_84_length_14850_cov_98_458703_g75_i0_p9_GENE_NODE_84_length_14850_cov_98_458703_g75_i0NODE_84_length_14850_cov_98_458703_g75_i0_p9_ORF_typecomplete_len196_score43_52_NODE_84_length_14850_cov_98_458703_g75_i054956082